MSLATREWDCDCWFLDMVKYSLLILSPTGLLSIKVRGNLVCVTRVGRRKDKLVALASWDLSQVIRRPFMAAQRLLWCIFLCDFLFDFGRKRVWRARQTLCHIAAHIGSGLWCKSVGLPNQTNWPLDNWRRIYDETLARKIACTSACYR